LGRAVLRERASAADQQTVLGGERGAPSITIRAAMI
jgi:hypothetical protein